MQIKNKSIMITGGGSGLGASTAKLFASKGGKVALLDVQKDKAEMVAEEIGGIAFECDVTSESSVTQALQATTKAHGVPRVLINCAGIAPGARVVGREGPMALDEFRKGIEINLIGSFNVMRLVATAMSLEEPIDSETGERGVIINTASVAAFDGQIGQASYAASKGGIASMTLPLARELANFGIRVMTIAPGLMETPMLTGMPEKVYHALIETTLFPKRLGKPEEYAMLAEQIVLNTLLNGETIRLDGAVRLPPK